MSITRKEMFKFKISQDFHEKTKLPKNNNHKELPYEHWPEDWKKVFFKGYPRFKAIKLSKPSLNNVSFKKVLFNRKSWRNFSGKSTSIRKISSLLYFSSGIKNSNPQWIANRFYPSAGARYPLEVYPIIFNIKGIESGIYHYYVKTHLFEILPKKKRYRELSLKYFENQEWVKKSNMLIVISAVFFRSKVKYGERGYRHIISELGSLMQNIYLVCAALNLGCCATGGYVDDGYNELLDLDGIEESVIGVIAIGEKV